MCAQSAIICTHGSRRGCGYLSAAIARKPAAKPRSSHAPRMLAIRADFAVRLGPPRGVTGGLMVFLGWGEVSKYDGVVGVDVGVYGVVGFHCEG